jgi:hypothetical protein
MPARRKLKGNSRHNKLVHFSLTERLHTDVLEEKYGPVSARVVRHDSRIREAHLVDAKGISRTFAVTFFQGKFSNPEIARINSQIQGGAAIGKAFREHGFVIRKNVVAVFVVRIPEWLQREFHLLSPSAKVRVSEFYAKKPGAKPVIYGEVAEIYTPDFRQPTVNSVDRSQVNPSIRTLEAQGFSKSDLWERLGAYNDWGNVKARYEKAKTASKREQFRWKRKITNFLKNK